MVQLKAAAAPKVERKENVLDASRLDAIKVDGPKKAEDGLNSKSASVTAIAS
jgi:hypothetical protein